MLMKKTYRYYWVIAIVGFLLGMSTAQTAYGDDEALLRKSSESFRAVAKKVGAAVVTVHAKQKAFKKGERRFQGRPELPDSYGGENPFEEFFGPRFPFPPGNDFSGRGPQEASGSGFIIDSRGYILTNYHVVKDSDTFEVALPDDEEKISAKLIGKDSRTDLAVLKIETKKSLPQITWENSDNVEVGDWAIAIGSPFMLTHSVTAGIVSAKGRNASNVMGAEYGFDLIQTDAAINPGNSGGPLCTLDAKVMGVNTAIYSKSGGYMGIGFAIPSSIARETAEALIQHGKIEHGWMGLRIAKADSEMLADLGVKKGVLVHEVDAGSPAEKAGIQAGDVIVQLSGKEVTTPLEVQKIVGAKHPGEKVKVNLVDYQNKKRKEAEVKLGELPADKG